jgi:hypothetical protein
MIKKLFTFLLLFTTFTSFSQRVIWEAKFFINSTSEVVTEQTPIMEGDTLRVEFHFRVLDAAKYQTLDDADTKYFFGDFQYNNDAFTRVDGGSSFPGIDNLEDGSPITATYFYDNYLFTSGRSYDVLQNRYSDWVANGGYEVDDQWSVVRTTFQLSDKEVANLIDSTTLETSIPFFQILFTVNQNAHQQDITDLKFFMSLGTMQDLDGTYINDFDPGHGEDGYVMDLVDDAGDNVIIKVHLPETLDPTNFNVYVNSTTDDTISYEGTLDVNGEFTINDIPYDGEYYASISPIDNSYIPDIHTVTDAYRSFLGVTDVGINGTERQFDVFETFIADVNMDDILDSRDVYWLLAYVTGILTTEESQNNNLCLPTSTTAEDGTVTWSWGCYTLVNYDNYTEELLGTSMDNWVSSFSPSFGGTNYFEFAHWNHSDVDFSHTTPYPASTTESPAREGFAHKTPTVGTLAHRTVGTINIDMVADIRDDGKVEVTLKLNDGDLAGLQSRIKYNESILYLEEVIFDTGNTLTNFSSLDKNNVVFGTISPNGDEQVKEGEIVKLIFETLEQINNTTGLFYFYNTDAVKLNGDKLILNIQ